MTSKDTKKNTIILTKRLNLFIRIFSSFLFFNQLARLTKNIMQLFQRKFLISIFSQITFNFTCYLKHSFHVFSYFLQYHTIINIKYYSILISRNSINRSALISTILRLSPLNIQIIQQ